MWYRDARWQSRLFAEEALMRERFPGFSLRRRQSGELFWEGTLEPVRGRRFRIRLMYPSRYPYQEPVLRVVRPFLRDGAPHRYADGSLCIHRSGWNPATGTAASMIGLASGWLVCYLNWLENGEGF